MSWWCRERRRRALRRGAAVIGSAARHAVEPLERRALFAANLSFAHDMVESEPNNTIATANAVAVSTTPNVVGGSIGNSADVDYFRFTLGARSGVFVDVDSLETGVSTTLDSLLRVFNADGSVEFDSNDDGRDFDTLALSETSNTTLVFGDSALYLDLNPGTYVIEMSGLGTTGAYDLKLTADSSYTASIPVLASLPGAADTIHLDFDGHSATDAWNNGNPYTIPAFSLDAAAGEFSPGERLAIYHTWRVVADALAPFNINVTTSYGGVYDDGIAHRQVIGSSDGSQVGHAGALGVAWMSGYSTGGPIYKTGFTFADNFADNPVAGISGQIVANAIEMGNTSAHEIGHTLGLDHYGTTAQRGAFMYTPDFGLNRERWSTGTNTAAALQDDLATIASVTNTFGYRSDDHGNSRPAATVLSLAGGTYSASGVIHQTGDLDYFRFSGSGATTIRLDIPEHLGHLNAELYLYNAAGTLIASADPATTLGATIAMSLPAAGDYYVEIRSDGGYSDLGMYDLRINTVTGGPTGSIAGRVFRDVTLNHSYEPGSGDTHLAGVTVYLDTDNDNILDPGEASTTSNPADGTYSFTGLANGAYNVKQIIPDGFVSNAINNVNITSGEPHADINFGNFPIEYDGSGGSDTYTVRLNTVTPTTLEIVESFSGLTYAAPRSLVSSLTLDGGAGGTDTLILEGTAGSDAIVIAGATATGAAANNVSFGGFESLTVNSGDGDDTLTISAAPAAPLQFNGGTNPANTDTLNIEAGSYTFNADAGNGTANLVVNVIGASASAVFNTTQHLEALNIADGFASVATNGAIMLVMQTFSMSGAAKLDLRDNDMIIHAGIIGAFNGTSYDGVTGYVASAYNFSSWDGNGLLTSMDDAGPNSGVTTLAVGTGYEVYGLGPTDAAEWQGETITGNSVVVKYTYAGDLNFDGLIDGADYGIIDNYVQFPGTTGYGNGDFNYDGIIDGADYGLIDNSIQFQGLPL